MSYFERYDYEIASYGENTYAHSPSSSFVCLVLDNSHSSILQGVRIGANLHNGHMRAAYLLTFRFSALNSLAHAH